MKSSKPKVLILDIETRPLLSYHWGLWDQTVGLSQIKEDWSVLAWAAKWHDEKKVMYQDLRHTKNKSDDKKLCEGIRELMDQADIIVTQNGVSFDNKKLNARFLKHGIRKPSPFKNIDTKRLATKHFSFTSNKLEYMSKEFNDKYQKLSHADFPGMSLWLECLKGNQKAWKSMEKYNKFDVLATEELYVKLIPWDSSIDFSLWTDSEQHLCSCGSNKLQARGFAYTTSGKFQRYQCTTCGKWTRDSLNLLTKEKRASLLKGV